MNLSTEQESGESQITTRVRKDIRNVVIIAHVDHGKTTLVDCLLKQSGQFRESQLQERVLDSNDLEKERGITILSKNIALDYKGVKINIIDTPGHADFGGEVERVVRMADGALLLIDAAEGPMPQTRFVLSKAIECGLQPIVVINKIDRHDARASYAIDAAFDLICDLGGEALMEDFPHVYATAKEGYATTDPNVKTDSMKTLLDMIMNVVPPPKVAIGDDFQMLVTTIDWNEFVGRVAIGRISKGQVEKGQAVTIMQADNRQTTGKIASVELFHNLGRKPVESANAGDVCALVGLDEIEIGDTICSLENPQALQRLEVGEPTLKMVFSINSSPFAGREGKYVTGRQLRERLYRELERNVALRVSPIAGTDAYAVSGRGVLHLAILIETMRREGYELSVSKPQVIVQKIDGAMHEPFETLVIEVPTENFGSAMELVGQRRGELVEMKARGDFTLAYFSIPARGLIGLRTKLLNATSGTATMHNRFESYRPQLGEIPKRQNGVLVCNVTGKANAYALDSLQLRADMFVAPGDEVYEGMIVGENARDNDLPVNPTREKKLTNIRAAGSDDNILLKPPRKFSLEAALEYVEDDELVEITPTMIRLRKCILRSSDRKRLGRT